MSPSEFVCTPCSISLAGFSKLLAVVVADKQSSPMQIYCVNSFEYTCYSSFQYRDIYNNRDNKLHNNRGRNFQYRPTLPVYIHMHTNI